jgi:hypothetical protein
MQSFDVLTSDQKAATRFYSLHLLEDCHSRVKIGVAYPEDLRLTRGKWKIHGDELELSACFGMEVST